MFSELAQELAAIRRLPIEQNRHIKRIPYEKATVYLRPGVLLDPARRVARTWPTTPYDGQGTIIVHFHEDGMDCGDGPGISAGGPYRVRHLRGPEVGTVEDLSAGEYLFIRAGNANSPYPKYEPCDPQEPLRGPILGSHFPSDYGKAKKLAARSLKKDPETITFEETKAYFEKRNGSNGDAIAK